MTRIRILQITALAATSLFAAVPAFAQTTPEGTPPPPPPPPTETTSTSPVAPMAKSADDMTGSLGFGVGLVAGAQFFGTNSQVAIKYWMSDTLAVVPALNFLYNKTQDIDATWALAPEAVLLYTPFRSTSTRFQLGGGLGFNLGAAAGADTAFAVYVPIQAGVEHFFLRWLSAGIAARSNLISVQTNDPWNISFAISSANLLGQVFFYTD